MSYFKESMQLVFRSFRRFLSLSLILASMILTVRLYELFVNSSVANYPAGSGLNLLIGLKFDLILYLRISAFLAIPFLVIAYFSQKTAKYFFVVVSLLLILGNMLLVKYFATARVPLGADLLGYSFQEMQHTIGASGKLNILPYVLIMLYLAFMVRVFIKHVYFRLKPWMMAVLAVMMLGSLLPLRQLTPDPSKFDNEFSLFLASNKLGFFAQSMADHYLHQGTLNDKPFTFKTVSVSPEGNPFTYIDPDYPFLHKETTPDVLGEYFNLGDTPPNIVLIIVESLGRAYSGTGAYLGSFTPFLDSLMQKSLYWENCLSTSGRTFQVLPATLASLPFGDHGFAALGDKMPDHLSLMSLLKNQAGYTSSFVYGGEAEFDKMDLFLNRQGVDQIIDSRNFGPEFSKLPATSNGFTWGYGDREIFVKYLENLKSRPDSLRLDVILTLAIHDPFNIPNQEYYVQKFEERLKILDIKEKSKTFDQQYSKELATVLYFDESLRHFFNEFGKLSSFNNTIFIITGDHRMPEIPISTQIDRFHVPLVIFSPLLNKSEKFSSITTHFDITPSLLALLNGKKYISRPAVASWIGHGLDNSVSFRSLNNYPFMRNVNEILDLLSAGNFLSNQTLYQIYPDLNIEPVEMTDLQQQLREELDNFMRKNNFACRNNKLIPDSLKRWSLPPGAGTKPPD
jgi:phosphoglycerol transferase MdoB-like AlkP superfamily enzyme